ncbi:hypothetical protein F4818DRAFT_437800 [Hypoxylon cercidicola]|nr:hypothetical protein F4818DRAFT_437800 [Hypoxylon cercidicola]
MASNQSSVQWPIDGEPGVIMTFPASVWKDYDPEHKAEVINEATHQSAGKPVQVLLDNTHPDRIILGVVSDILNHHPYLKIEACLFSGEPTIGIFVDVEPDHGDPAPSEVQTPDSNSPVTDHFQNGLSPRHSSVDSGDSNTNGSGSTGSPTPSGRESSRD